MIATTIATWRVTPEKFPCKSQARGPEVKTDDVFYSTLTTTIQIELIA